MTKTILVTGGAGFIGSNFVHQSIEEDGCKVVVLDKLTYAGNLENLAVHKSNPKLVFIRGDISDIDCVSALMAEHEPEQVVNFAAESHVDRSIHAPGEFLETNVVGTYRLLQAVLGHFKGLKNCDKDRFRFVHVSTDEVYGSLDPEDAAFSETTAYAPNSPYSASKAASDHLARAWHHTYGLPVIITNCSNNYGPHQFPEKLIPLLITKALQGEDLPIYGDGQNIRDWLYVGDHCSALRRVLERARVGECYNIGGNCEKTNLEVVTQLCRVLDTIVPREDGRSYLEQKIFVTDRPGHDRRYAIDARKLAEELDWVPATCFEEGLEHTVRWYLENPGWVNNILTGQHREWMDTNYASRGAAE